MIPAGIYRARAIAGSEQFQPPNDNGTEAILIRLELLTPPAAGAHVQAFLYFSDNAAEGSIRRLRALGWQGVDLTQLDGIDANEAEVEIKYETWKGKERMKVEIRAGGGITLDKPMSSTEQRKFAARYRALAEQSATNGTPSGARRQAPSPAPAPAQPEEEFPF